MNDKADGSRLYARVSGDLATKIAGGQFALGDRLPSERELAQSYGVSRPTVREAVIALEVDGLVEVRLGSGVYVTATRPRGGTAGMTDIGPFELLEARRAIEGEACALAAAHVTDDELATLGVCVREMQTENAHDDIVLSEVADRRFHLLIASATRNSAVIAAVEMLWDARARSPQSKLLSSKAHAAGVKPRIDEHSPLLMRWRPMTRIGRATRCGRISAASWKRCSRPRRFTGSNRHGNGWRLNVGATHAAEDQRGGRPPREGIA